MYSVMSFLHWNGGGTLGMLMSRVEAKSRTTVNLTCDFWLLLRENDECTREPKYIPREMITTPRDFHRFPTIPSTFILKDLKS